MELKEITNLYDTYLTKIKELWGSLWHRRKKQQDKRTWRRNKSAKILGW